MSEDQAWRRAGSFFCWARRGFAGVLACVEERLDGVLEVVSTSLLAILTGASIDSTTLGFFEGSERDLPVDSSGVDSPLFMLFLSPSSA